MKKVILCLLFCLLLVPFSLSCDALSARSAVVIDGNTGKIIFESNCSQRLSMASTTKIMTALLLCENRKMSDKIKVANEAVLTEGSSMGLKAGDTVTACDLLYGMMLSSGNDAANAVALEIGGSFEKFAALMNKRAKKIKLKNTNFVTPSGLDDENHYTTAYDLALLTREAMKNGEFCRAASTESITLNIDGVSRTLTNHNRLLKESDCVIGVKTGFTKKSGRCLVTAAKRDGKYVIAVTLNDPDDWRDHRELLESGLEAAAPYSKAEPISKIQNAAPKKRSVIKDIFKIFVQFLLFGEEYEGN